MYAINWGRARLGWHLLFFGKTALPPPTAALPPLAGSCKGAWRQLAPPAESLVRHGGTRHSTQHVRHSDAGNSATACIIIWLSVLQTINYHCYVEQIRKQGIPKYLCWRQGSVGWGRPRHSRHHWSNRLQNQETAAGGVPTLSLTHL